MKEEEVIVELGIFWVLHSLLPNSNSKFSFLSVTVLVWLESSDECAVINSALNQNFCIQMIYLHRSNLAAQKYSSVW